MRTILGGTLGYHENRSKRAFVTLVALCRRKSQFLHVKALL